MIPTKRECGAAMIGYFFMLWFVPLMESKKSDYAYFHGKQAMILFFMEIMFTVFCVLIGSLPFLHWLSSLLIGLAIFGFMILSFICMALAFQGKRFEIPVVAEFAKQLTF